MPIVAVSGGFDPVHGGHLDLFEGAAKYGDVVVILNSDFWLLRKKGYSLQNWETRARILKSLWCVSDVIKVDDNDDTVLKGLMQLHPDYFANGGDRNGSNTPEVVYCIDNGIKLLWGVGGGKTASSSELVEDAVRAMPEVPLMKLKYPYER